MNLNDPEILRAVLESLLCGVYVTDPERRILLWSDGAEQITGHLRQEVMGRKCPDVLRECSQEGRLLCDDSCQLRDSMRDGKAAEGLVCLRHKAGHRVPVLASSVPIRNPHGLVIGVVKSFRARQSSFIQELRQNVLASFGCLDLATGLHHRGLAATRLRHSLETFQEHQLPFGILCVRIDQFEAFCRIHSRDAADAALRVVGRTLTDNLRQEDFLGRWSDEQLLVILANCPGIALPGVATRVQRIARTASIQWWGDWLPIPVSLSYAAAEIGDTVESLLERARSSFSPSPNTIAAVSNSSED